MTTDTPVLKVSALEALVHFLKLSVLNCLFIVSISLNYLNFLNSVIAIISGALVLAYWLYKYGYIKSITEDQAGTKSFIGSSNIVILNMIVLFVAYISKIMYGFATHTMLSNDLIIVSLIFAYLFVTNLNYVSVERKLLQELAAKKFGDQFLKAKIEFAEKWVKPWLFAFYLLMLATLIFLRSLTVATISPQMPSVRHEIFPTLISKENTEYVIEVGDSYMKNNNAKIVITSMAIGLCDYDGFGTIQYDKESVIIHFDTNVYGTVISDYACISSNGLGIFYPRSTANFFSFKAVSNGIDHYSYLIMLDDEWKPVR